jgi:hypothetical protein
LGDGAFTYCCGRRFCCSSSWASWPGGTTGRARSGAGGGSPPQAFGLIAPGVVALSIWGQAWSDAHPALTSALDLTLRLCAAILFWRIAIALAPRASGRALSALAPLAFLMFCGHMTIIWFGGPWLGQFTGPLGSPAYPLLLLVQPLLVLAATAVLREGLMVVSPGVAAFLSGGQARVAQPNWPTPSSLFRPDSGSPPPQPSQR